MYTMEQIIEALQALNATNNTNAYASKFASSGSAYASRIRNSGSPLLVYIPAATALAVIVAVIVYHYRASTAEHIKTRKILERKQTGFFRPKRVDPRTDREVTRKLSAVQCLQIIEVLANATDEVTTLDKENGDYNSGEVLPEDVTKTVLTEPFGEHDGSEHGSISSLSVSVDSEEEANKNTLHYDSESTPINSMASNHEQSEHERQRYLADAFESQNENDESAEGSQSLVEPEGASIMSDDEGYTRQMGGEGSPGSFATARVNRDPPRAFPAPSQRRSSWHGEGM
jgi:hypothetical protein